MLTDGQAGSLVYYEFIHEASAQVSYKKQGLRADVSLFTNNKNEILIQKYLIFKI